MLGEILVYLVCVMLAHSFGSLTTAVIVASALFYGALSDVVSHLEASDEQRTAASARLEATLVRTTAALSDIHTRMETGNKIRSTIANHLRRLNPASV